jgi:hypothetical protein
MRMDSRLPRFETSKTRAHLPAEALAWGAMPFQAIIRRRFRGGLQFTVWRICTVISQCTVADYRPIAPGLHGQLLEPSISCTQGEINEHTGD